MVPLLQPVAAGVEDAMDLEMLQASSGKGAEGVSVPKEGNVTPSTIRTGNSAPCPTTTTRTTMLSPQDLLLQPYHVVLGRYNHNKKTKPLTPAVDLYRQVRSQTKRSYSMEQLDHVRQAVAVLLQEDRCYKQTPTVTFWVDVTKARMAGKLEELQGAHPQLRSCIDFDGQQVTFVQDHDDCFLRADLMAFKSDRRRAPSKKNASSGIASSRVIVGNDAVTTIGKFAPASMERRGSARTVSTLADQDARTVSTLADTDTSLTDVFHSGSSIAGNYFQLVLGSKRRQSLLGEETDLLCCHWISEGPPRFDTIRRKTYMVEIFKSFMKHYETILTEQDHFRTSPVPTLRRMKDSILVQVTNTLGNAMVEWYNQHPDTCLPGEAHEWVVESFLGSDRNVESDHTAGGSLGTWAPSDAYMSDASHTSNSFHADNASPS